MSEAATKNALQAWIDEGLGKLGKTNTELARLLGIPQSRVSEMRRGIRMPKLSELPVIAAYLEEMVPPEIEANLALVIRHDTAGYLAEQRMALADKLASQRREAEALAEARVAAARAAANKKNLTFRPALPDQLPDELPKAPQSPTVEVPLLSWVSAGKMAFPDVSEDMIGVLRVSDLEPRGDWIALRVVGDSMDRISPPDSVIFVDRADKVLVPNACYVISSNDGEASYKRFRSNPMRFEPVSTNPAHEPIYPTREPLIVGRVKKSMIEM